MPVTARGLSERVGQVSHALAEQKGGFEEVEGLGARLLSPGSPCLPSEGDGENRLVGGIREELIFEGHLEIAEAALRPIVCRGVEEIPLPAERDTEIGEDTLRELAGNVGDLACRYFAITGLLDVKKGGER
jgi:hypothetical protein